MIPKKVTKIEKYTFARCPNLKRVGLHDKIRKINDDVFSGRGRKGKVSGYQKNVPVFRTMNHTRFGSFGSIDQPQQLGLISGKVLYLFVCNAVSNNDEARGKRKSNFKLCWIILILILIFFKNNNVHSKGIHGLLK